MQKRKTKNSSKNKGPWYVVDLENNYSEPFDTREQAMQHMQDIVANIEEIALHGIRTAPAFHLLVTRNPKKHLRKFISHAYKSERIETLLRLWERGDISVPEIYIEGYGRLPIWELRELSPLEQELRKHGQW